MNIAASDQIYCDTHRKKLSSHPKALNPIRISLMRWRDVYSAAVARAETRKNGSSESSGGNAWAIRTVNPLTVVVDNLLDQTLGLQSPHGLSGDRSVDLHSLDQDGLRDHLVSRDFLEDLVAAAGVGSDKKAGRWTLLERDLLGGLVNHDGVVGLVLHLSLGPLLLLTVSQSRVSSLPSSSCRSQIVRSTIPLQTSSSLILSIQYTVRPYFAST